MCGRGTVDDWRTKANGKGRGFRDTVRRRRETEENSKTRGIGKRGYFFNAAIRCGWGAVYDSKTRASGNGRCFARTAFRCGGGPFDDPKAVGNSRVVGVSKGLFRTAVGPRETSFVDSTTLDVSGLRKLLDKPRDFVGASSQH